MHIRALLVAAKIAFFLLALGSLGMALLADEAGPWVFGVFPATVILATLTIAVSRSMKMRAAMRAVDEEDDSSAS
ncbi:MAG: hypothetical protein AB8H86_21505 [Polyangiales bacterium]